MGFGGVAAFTQLTDAPRSYEGQALKVIAVRAGEDGLEFAVGLPPLDFGAGFNFLRVSQLGGELFAEWADIQSLIISLTAALNRLITPPELLLPAPVAAQVTVAAASPPGRVAAPALPVPAPSATATPTGATAGGFTSNPVLPVPALAIGATAVLV